MSALVGVAEGIFLCHLRTTFLLCFISSAYKAGIRWQTQDAFSDRGTAAGVFLGLAADVALFVSIPLVAVVARNERTRGTAYQSASTTASLTRA